MKPQILFLCTGNSCRSQMAEGWAKHLKGEYWQVYSAGTNPQGLNPLAVTAMQEVGVDISQHYSKHIDELRGKEWDLIITVCSSADQNCPVISGAYKKLHHSFDDPPALAKNCLSEQDALVHYRRVRDEIKAFISNLEIK